MSFNQETLKKKKSKTFRKFKGKYLFYLFFDKEILVCILFETPLYIYVTYLVNV